MKKLLILFLATIPLVCSAQFKYSQIKDNPMYGPQSIIQQSSNNKVCLVSSFDTAGKTIPQVMNTIDALLGENGTLTKAPARYALVSSTDNMRIYQISDELVFHRNFISSDVAQMSARLVVSVNNNGGTVNLDNIVYRIGTTDEQLTGMPHEKWKSGYSVSDSGVEIVPAEEYISDREALTKRGKLVRSLAKYRVKTIDYVNTLCQNIGKHLE